MTLSVRRGDDASGETLPDIVLRHGASMRAHTHKHTLSGRVKFLSRSLSSYSPPYVAGEGKFFIFGKSSACDVQASTILLRDELCADTANVLMCLCLDYVNI